MVTMASTDTVAKPNHANAIEWHLKIDCVF